jgi:hypothetical protein
MMVEDGGNEHSGGGVMSDRRFGCIVACALSMSGKRTLTLFICALAFILICLKKRWKKKKYFFRSLRKKNNF